MSSNLIPNPLDSDQEYHRYYHCDLDDIEIEDLLCELCSTRYRLWLLKSDRFGRSIGLFEQGRRIKWLRERIFRIEAELSQRRYVAWETKNQPKRRLAEGVRL